MSHEGDDRMLRDLIERWPTEMSLTPYSGVQFLDFGFNIDNIGRGTTDFAERIAERRAEGDVWRLYPRTGDVEYEAEIPAIQVDGEADYSISKVKALEPFLRKWTPVPVLRIRPGAGPRGEEHYDGGPSTWARLYLLELDERYTKSGDTHRAILALDTDLDEDDAGEDDPTAPYLMPTRKDAADERAFRLVCNSNAMGWFLRKPITETDGTEFDQQKWVDDWLRGQFLAFKQAQRPRREVRSEDLPYQFEHWARYLAMLQVLEMAIRPPKLHMIDTVSDDRRYQCVEVDLVLDVGNSRTCGILVESYPNDTRVDLNNSFALAMRDLGRPEHYYRRPFESRVEFAQPNFGPEHVARRSGRTRPAFLWPSLVRVGPEASRLVQASEGTETVSGLSSPKRYLWDVDSVIQDWRFRGDDVRQTLPLIARSAFRFLNEAGDVIEQVKAEEATKLRERNVTSKTSAIRPRFSRSALYGFMLAELITHALVQINDPASRATRKQSDLPRRLRNIILTLPSATPVQEQSIMRSRAEGALKLVWSILGWREDKATTCRVPNVVVDWDEASCTQLVWLYDAIAHRFEGQIEPFFALKGKLRPRPAEWSGSDNVRPSAQRLEPSLRIGCIDIGGGTTDLMITTLYSEDNRAIRPYQNVREGFRIAGDDIVEGVIARVLLPQLRDNLEASGCTFADEMLRELFAGDVGDVAEQSRQRRRQFALQILTPAALAVLEICEGLAPEKTHMVHLGDLVGRRRSDHLEPETESEVVVRLDVADQVIGYVEAAARERGAEDWHLAALGVDVRPLAVENIVRDVLGPPLEAMTELIAHLNVDVLLLSGRPTRLPSVRDLVRESLTIRPDRIIAMHDYQVERWYPYRDRVSDRIGDPKTTAAVGGMLCLLAANRIVNFKLHTQELRMRSTARFIGEMERNGQIQADRVLFSDVDLQARARGEETRDVVLRSPIHIGFRQVQHERWIANPLYRLDFSNENAQRLPTPLTVTIKRRESDDDIETEEQRLRAEALKEAFVVDAVKDAEEFEHKPDAVVNLALHTLGIDEHDYWLDTGIFRIG